MNRIKERCIELEESGDYQEARDEEFNNQFWDMFKPVGKDEVVSVTEDDIQGFLDSFEFPDEDEWICSKAESEYDDWADAKYQEWKERDI